jgi:hypothetical protein
VFIVRRFVEIRSSGSANNALISKHIVGGRAHHMDCDFPSAASTLYSYLKVIDAETVDAFILEAAASSMQMLFAYFFGTSIVAFKNQDKVTFTSCFSGGITSAGFLTSPSAAFKPFFSEDCFQQLLICSNLCFPFHRFVSPILVILSLETFFDGGDGESLWKSSDHQTNEDGMGNEHRLESVGFQERIEFGFVR